MKIKTIKTIRVAIMGLIEIKKYESSFNRSLDEIEKMLKSGDESCERAKRTLKNTLRYSEFMRKEERERVLNLLSEYC